jgi:hypothetical protein
VTASPRQAWAAGIRQVHEESCGLLSLRFVSADHALDLIAASLGGDQEATQLMATVTRVLARIGSMPKRTPALCGCCPRPLRRTGYIVCLAVPERTDPENCVGFGICARCSSDKTKLDEKAVGALSKLFPAVRSIPLPVGAGGHA